MACLEDKPWELIGRTPKSVEHFAHFCTSLEAKFLYLGIPAPNIRNVSSFSEIYPAYCQHYAICMIANFLGLSLQ